MKVVYKSSLLLFLATIGCQSDYAVVVGEEQGYPVHKNVTVTIFWVGEEASRDNTYIDNKDSAWDNQWEERFGGLDDPDNREGYYPKGFIPNENPFYFALPFNDFTAQGDRKSIVYSVVPWANSKATWASNESMLKNRWIKIVKDGKSAYAQWQDVGPFQDDDHGYVFGSEHPLNEINGNAALDVSPAVTDYLGLGDIDLVDWVFVAPEDVPDGPWKTIITTSQINWY